MRQQAALAPSAGVFEGVGGGRGAARDSVWLKLGKGVSNRLFQIYLY